MTFTLTQPTTRSTPKTPAVKPSPALDYFVGLANDGLFENSTKAEVAAYRMAEAALTFASDLDQQASIGFIAFMAMAKMMPSEAAKLID